jgi:anti-sigma factor ChrR (cupin superfamily)
MIKREECIMQSVKNLLDDSNWIPADNYPVGAQKKVLRDQNGAGTILLKLPKGFKMEAHSHVTVEQHFVLEGSYTSSGLTYPSGSYQLIYAHEDHGPFESRDGALILVIWDPF